MKIDGSIDWSKAPGGRYVLDAEGKAIKKSYTQKMGEIIDRYGPIIKFDSEEEALGVNSESTPEILH